MRAIEQAPVQILRSFRNTLVFAQTGFGFINIITLGNGMHDSLYGEADHILRMLARFHDPVSLRQPCKQRIEPPAIVAMMLDAE